MICGCRKNMILSFDINLCLECLVKERDKLLLQVDAYRKMEADIAKEVGCSMSNWGESSDWCGVHQRDPMECQSLEIFRMNRVNNELRQQLLELREFFQDKAAHFSMLLNQKENRIGERSCPCKGESHDPDCETSCSDHGTLKPCRHCLGNRGL